MSESDLDLDHHQEKTEKPASINDLDEFFDATGTYQTFHLNLYFVLLSYYIFNHLKLNVF